MPAVDIFHQLYSGIRSKKSRIKIQSGEPILSYTLCRLTADKNLLPTFVGDHTSFQFPVPAIFEAPREGKVVAWFSIDGKKTPAITLVGKYYIFSFDPVQTISYILGEEYYKPTRRLYTHLPLHFHILPGWLRRVLKRLVIRQKKKESFPAWPADVTVDMIRSLTLACLGTKTTPSLGWPQKKKYAVCLTHDVESGAGLSWSTNMAEVEKKFGMKSSWSIVSNHYPVSENIIRDFKSKGDEILVHGYNHDNKLIYLDGDGMRERFEGMKDFGKKFGVVGFRSPCLLRNKKLYRMLGEYGYRYDSSAPDTETGSQIAYRNGCTSVYPFFREGMLILPLTLPQDANLLTKGYTPEEILDIWIKKTKFIASMGGIVTLNTHPETHLSGNAEMLEIYKKYLSFLTSQKNAWIVPMKDVAHHLLKKFSV